MQAKLEEGQYLNFYKVTMPIIMSVFCVYLTIGLALGVLPKFVQQTLGYDSFVVGLVVGLQFLSTLLTRSFSGKMADTKGAKSSKVLGVFLVVVAGFAYTLSALFHSHTALALGLLLLARIMHGVGESFLVTGAMTWAIGLVGASNSGKVMTWNGIAIYAGISIGAPLSIGLSASFGYVSAFLCIMVLPLLGLIFTSQLPILALVKDQVRTPFYKVIGAIAGQGLSLALSSLAFGCIASFIALFFAEKNWGEASLAFMVFGACYVLTRIFFASFPDRFGGFSVAFISLLIEAVGQLLIWTATGKTMAIVGCGLTGVGSSLIFPALGVLALQKVSPQMRGTALGAYAAFVDMSVGLAAPLAGLAASYFNYQAVYLFGAISAVLAMVVLGFNRK